VQLAHRHQRRRGFIEGQNLAVEYRAYGLHVDLVSEYAAELVNARVDVIVTAGDVATIRAAQQATKTIPILAMTDDMVRLGLVASLARPDGNTTGVSILALELDGKRQEILIEAVPGLRRMAFLADANFETVAKLDALQEAARGHNIDLSIHRIAKGEEITAAIDAAKASGVEGLNFRRHHSSSLIVSSLWTASQRCACRRSMNGLKQRRKAALSPMDPASVSYL
jgi:putative tryptophan/tyrosine transport system substrate-binding protein